MHTPLFPQWRPRFAPIGSRLLKVRQVTLSELELFFAAIFPFHLLAQADDGLNSRERVFTIRRTFWLFLSQVLTPHTSCRAIVRQVQATLGLHSEKQIESANNAYIQARARLPFERLLQALGFSAATADRRCARNAAGFLAGRPIKVVDTTSTQLPDTTANQLRYPQPAGQKRGCGFPVMKVMALFSLASGAILHVVHENLHWHDSRLFRRLWQFLRPGDILLGDRAFSDYTSLAELSLRKVDLIARLHTGRKADFRKPHKRLGRWDALFEWAKPLVRPKYMTAKQWKRVPQQVLVRVLRLRIDEPGFRTRNIRLVTTLTDHRQFPAEALHATYRRRWRLELCFRDLKTTMGMERLSCQSPAMARKELYMYLIAHNLIRCLMAEAAGIHEVELERVSFKGSVDATREFSHALARAGSRKKRRRLEDELLRILATDLVPERPNRREPRATKHRPKPHPLLNCPRHKYKEVTHRNRYWKGNPRKTKRLN